MNWNDMKAYLRQRFCPPGFQDDKMNEFLELTQGKKSIEEYHQSFANLLRYAPGMDDDGLLKRFISRQLNPPLDKFVKNAKPSSISEAMIIC